MVATKNGKCQDRCGLAIHAGHDEIERGHYGWRHVDCEKAHLQAWIRERMDAGDQVADVQIKLGLSTGLTIDASLYALNYADQQATAA